jgi:general secretion pathway protein G
MTSLLLSPSSAPALPEPETRCEPQRPLRASRHAAWRAAQAGFTLLEILVVLVIIGLLAGLVGPRLLSQLDRAKITTAETQIRMLKGALETMRLDLGRFPSAEEGLALLTTPPADGALRQRWRGPYLDGQVPIDPWVNPYQYDPRGRDTNPFALYSFGPDGPSAPASAYIGFPPPSG